MIIFILHHCFVCFGFCPTLDFFTHVETSPLPVKGCKFWHILGTEQWRFFSVLHLLWHRLIVYDGYIRGPAILTLVAERFIMELLQPVLGLSQPDSNTQSSTCETNISTNCATAMNVPLLKSEVGSGGFPKMICLLQWLALFCYNFQFGVGDKPFSRVIVDERL